MIATLAALEKGVSLHLNKPGSVVLEKKIFKFRKCIFTISKLSLLGKRLGPLF